jgi:lipase maturation factor 1
MRLFRARGLPGPIAKLHDALAPFNAVSPYGLFAVMTTERPEVVVEGSDDGVTWREYGFRYKVGDVGRAPSRAAPHQPRLDWQMWFAALGAPPVWFVQFLRRLLEASPEVLALLEHDPFTGRRPRYVRALLYDYKMTDRATRQATGHWWRRELLGAYVRPLELSPPGEK